MIGRPRRRVMIVPATAGTYYPTGKILGVKDNAGALWGAADSRSTTATDSWFNQNIRPVGSAGTDGAVTGQSGPISMQRASVIVSITVLAAGAASTIEVQSHGGTVLIPAIAGITEKTLLFGDEGFMIQGGWRIVTVSGTAPLLAIEWEEDER